MLPTIRVLGIARTSPNRQKHDNGKVTSLQTQDWMCSMFCELADCRLQDCFVSLDVGNVLALATLFLSYLDDSMFQCIEP